MKENNKQPMVFAECIRLIVMSTILATCIRLISEQFAKIRQQQQKQYNGVDTMLDETTRTSSSSIAVSSSSPFKLNYTTVDQSDVTAMEGTTTEDIDTATATTTPKKIITLPEVMLIGTQKSGTSALALLLYDVIGACRPAVFDNEPYYFDKECHFFDISPRYREGIEFYAKRYEHCANDNSYPILDATPGYFVQAERIYETYQEAETNDNYTTTKPNIKQNVKFIAVLREPIARELSVYNHKAWLWTRKQLPGQWYSDVAKADGGTMTFTEYVTSTTIPNVTAIDIEKKHGNTNYHLGYYSHHLRLWFQHFDRSQILLLSHDELKRSPHTTRKRIVDFLGIEHTLEIDNYEFPHENAKESDDKVYKVPCKAKQYMSEHFDHINDELYTLLDEYSTNRPSMEEYPFPRFISPECEEEEENEEEEEDGVAPQQQQQQEGLTMTTPLLMPVATTSTTTEP